MFSINKKYYSQADAVLVDTEGHQHHVHGVLLALKIPVFRSLGKIKHVSLDGVSSDVAKLIIGMVYGHEQNFPQDIASKVAQFSSPFFNLLTTFLFLEKH